MSCGIGCRRSSDLVLLWLWYRQVATAPIQPLTWEFPYAATAALKKKKKKKEKKRKRKKKIKKEKKSTNTGEGQRECSLMVTGDPEMIAVYQAPGAASVAGAGLKAPGEALSEK